jgi:ribonuclease P protein component
LRHEENFSTQQPEAQAHPRVSCPDAYQERSSCHQGTASQGSRPPVCLTIFTLVDAAARYPRGHRLLTAAQYQRVFKRCEHKAKDRLISVLAVANQLDYPRLGMVVSVKAAGNAVKRNRIKRLIRESFRLHQALLDGLDLVVLVRPGISSRSNQQIVSTLETHWRTIAANAHTAPEIN